VGRGYHDDRRLRGHNTEDLPRHVHRVAVRPHGGPDHRPPRSGHRQQLRPLLLAHSGQGETAQEETEDTAGGGRATEGTGPRQGTGDAQAGRPKVQPREVCNLASDSRVETRNSCRWVFLLNSPNYLINLFSIGHPSFRQSDDASQSLARFLTPERRQNERF